MSDDKPESGAQAPSVQAGQAELDQAPQGAVGFGDLTPEQIEELKQRAYAAQVQDVMGVAWPFVSAFMTAEQLQPLAEAVIREQQQIAHDIWPTLFEDEEYKSIHIRMWGPEAEDPSDEKHQILMIAPKQIRGTAADAGMRHFTTVAFLLSPPTRLLARCFGYQYRFEQSKQDCWSEQKRIITLDS